MKTLTPRFLKILTFIGLLCLSIPISILGIWIYVFNLADNQPDRLAILYSYFPDFLHGQYTTSFLSVAFCISAIILSSISVKLSGILWKSLNIIILIIGCLLLLLNLFQLM